MADRDTSTTWLPEGRAYDAAMRAESDTLLRSLQQQRAHVLGILEGLSDEQWRRPVLPSGWTCQGLLNHLAIDVERFWFRAVVAADQSAWDSLGAEPAWRVDVGTPPSEVLSLYRAEAARSDEVIAATDLGAAPGRWPDFFGDFRLPDLRAVIMHVLTETACHAGHLDAARELLDGRQWMVLP